MSANDLKVGRPEIIPLEQKQSSLECANQFSSIKAGLKEGATGEEVRDLQLYLQALGYLQEDDAVNVGEFDDVTVAAVKDYQSFHNLSATGSIDENTLQLLNTPRCGVPDIAPRKLASSLRTLRNPWPKNNLNYYFQNLDTSPDIDTLAEAAAAFQSGYSLWHAVTPIRFQHTTTNTTANPADIIILWGTPGCGGAACTDTPAVGSSITRAYTLFWSRALWKVNNPQSGDYDMVAFAAHEIGHALGLYWVGQNGEILWHSPDSSALMWDEIPAGRRSLQASDIEAARRVFG